MIIFCFRHSIEDKLGFVFFTRINHDLGKTIILVTHDKDIAGKADYIYTISDGRIVDWFVATLLILQGVYSIKYQ